MAVLVGDEREQIPGVHALVYVHMLPHVLHQQKPVVRMCKLIPLTETAQVLLVIILQGIAVYLKPKARRSIYLTI